MSSYNLTKHELLVQVNDKVAETLIPAMIFVGTLMIVGLFGNILVCYIFSTKFKSGTQNFMIVCLAVSDLLACVIAMPTEIVDMRYYYMFDSVFACKLFRFVNVLCAMCSILILTTIAVDRYIKVCRPLGRQMALRESKLCVVGALTVGILLSWPALFIYGSRSAETDIPGVVGIDCSTSDSIKDTLYPLIYNCVLFVGFICLTVAFVVIYIKIYRDVKKHKKYMNKIAISTPSSPVVSTIEFQFPALHSTSSPTINADQHTVQTNSSTLSLPNGITKSNSSSLQNLDAPITISESVNGNERIVSFKTESSPGSKSSVDTVYVPFSALVENTENNKTKVIPPPLELPRSRSEDPESEIGSTISCSTPKKKKLGALLGRENKTTVIACLITTVFVLSYLPYLGLVFAAIFNKDFDHQLKGSNLAAFNLFIRSYFVNSAANPIIYGVLNYRFRYEVKAMMGRMMIWKKENDNT
ncbi:hypothetical protein LOTGIDRAFT_229072 [Lottia gigantea]|uniref:G-protein coupled receptors family 1 profile domain-containing protein n=1 Tax=Lottia gigantea TaxID=225164 RepID=V3ZXP2_LOTGI|nr:hypothetical protein LOTGIDRAFT_229072 [Lottia gigantea]ESO89172.1 hypothetical protein LOTGIDRAFT_229072 [Lottia gigantea]